MSKVTDEELMENVLSTQIPEAVETDTPEPVQQEMKPESMIGKKLRRVPGESPLADKEGDEEIVKTRKLSRVGDQIDAKAEIREGWIDVNKDLLGERAKFYPEDWNFRIRPATVEAIRNWSTIDDENINSLDDVFNEVLKSCISIHTSTGLVPWGKICSWDRFFFLLLIREYTFIQGEHELAYEEDCIECDNPITFKLTSQSLMYEFPDESLYKYYDPEERVWYIDPEEYGIEGEAPVKLYVPTLEKDANVKAWMISKLRENQNKKFDPSFLRFVGWLTPSISKDATISNKQIKDLEMKFKSWDTEMFTFMDEVLRNIIVTPSTKLVATCPVCGEEVTSNIRFPNSVRDLFSVPNQHRKFGTK